VFQINVIEAKKKTDILLVVGIILKPSPRYLNFFPLSLG
jgi:hypothetical protein